MKFHTLLRQVLNEKICSTSECYDIQKIFSVHWYSLVVKMFRRPFATKKLYEISHTSETSPKWKDLFNIWMLLYTNIFSVHWYSLVVKVFRRQFARINLYEISHTSKTRINLRQFARINLYEISHTSETIPKLKDLFNIWMLWYSTNIFS